jgi:RNA polymerase sigma-70 factor (ECF subfamily)
MKEVAAMTDAQILHLYESRDESAIAETASCYGSLCMAISMRILHNREDCEEVVSDTYLRLWNSIPPEKPQKFSSFLGRIVKNLSLDRCKARKAAKRSEEFCLMLSELESCVPSRATVEGDVDSRDTGRAIEAFLREIPRNDAAFFVRRYWFSDSVGEIATRYEVSESKVKSSLMRTRNKLKSHLEKEDYHD